MALHLVRANDDFQIYGPVVMNAEVIAYEDEVSDIHKLGIGQKREHLHQLVKESYDHIAEIVEISPANLPYSLEGKQIDGAVLDITKAALLPKFKFTSLSENDYISYSLIVRKDVVNTEAFREFLRAYNKTIEELNNVEILKKHISMPKEFWDNINIKFLSLE
jgi:hypothetical protein